MTPRRLRVAFVDFPYGGVGAAAIMHPDITDWLLRATIAAKNDQRIEEVFYHHFSDTPITMSRNAAIEWAKSTGVDVLVMVDSDQAPDLYLGVHADAKPFFESSFDFLYKRWEKGPVAVVAPYCGPPAHPVHGGGEVVYIFRWANQNSGEPSPGFRQERFTREEAGYQTGFAEISAGPTGLCMIDMRCFDLLQHPYFYYDWEADGVACPTCRQPRPGPRAEKSSTEDCAFFRDLSLNSVLVNGYNCCFVNWDSWAGHWKPKCVGKPEMIKTDQVADVLRNVVLNGQVSDRKIKHVTRGNLPVHEKDRAGVKFATNPNRTYVGVENGKAVKEWLCEKPEFKEENPNPANLQSPLDSISLHLRVGEKGVNENGQRYEVVHPDDPRLADEAKIVDVESAIREIQNTHPDDLEIVLAAVKARAIEADLESRVCRIVELGTWVGQTACKMAEMAVEYSDYEIHCVDTFEGGNTLQRRAAKNHDVYAEFLKNTKPFGRNIVAHRNDTKNMAVAWGQRDPEIRDIDMIFVDAGHSYEDCRDDILNWWPYLRDGGVMVGHDFQCLFPGVVRAAIECFGYGVPFMNNCFVVKKGFDKLVCGLEHDHQAV